MRRLFLLLALLARLTISLFAGLFLTGLAAAVLSMVLLNLHNHGFSAGAVVTAVIFLLVTVGSLGMTVMLVRSSWKS